MLLAPPKMLRNTGLLLFARQKIEIPVRRGKIPVTNGEYVNTQVPATKRDGRTLRDDLPNVHDEEDGPEKTDTLRRHLVGIVKRLEQVRRRDYTDI